MFFVKIWFYDYGVLVLVKILKYKNIMWNKEFCNCKN